MMNVERHVMEVMQAEMSDLVDASGELISFSSLFPIDEPKWTSEGILEKQRAQCACDQWCINATADIVSEYESKCKREPQFKELVAQKASTDPDTMYRHEAMKEPDYAKFLQAMEKEIQDQMGNGNFRLVKGAQFQKQQRCCPQSHKCDVSGTSEPE